MPATTRPRNKRHVVKHIDRKTGQMTEAYVMGRDEAHVRIVCAQHRIEPLAIRLYRRGETAEVGGGFRFCHANLRLAEKELGLKWPVKYVTTSVKGGVNGKQGARLDRNGRPYHRVMVKSYLSPEKAGEVLWHELRHCQQTEALCESMGVMPKTPEYARAHNLAYRGLHPGRQRGTRYRTRSWEVEARATERNNARLPLAR